MKNHFCTVLVFAFFCMFVEVKSEEPMESRHLFPVARNGKIGFIDQDGKVVLPCEYSMYTHPKTVRDEWFREARQIANDNSLKEMDEENSSGYFCYIPNNEWGSSGMIPIVKDGKVGFLRKDGTIVVEPQYTGATNFRNGRAWVSNEKGEYLFLDDTGKVLMDGIEEVGYFSGYNLAELRRIDWNPNSPPIPVKKEGKWGFMDWSGKLVIPCQFDDVQGQLYGMKTLVTVVYQGRRQLVDDQGNIYDYEPISWRGDNNYLLLNRKRVVAGFTTRKKVGLPVKSIVMSEFFRKDCVIFNSMAETANAVIWTKMKML